MKTIIHVAAMLLLALTLGGCVITPDTVNDNQRNTAELDPAHSDKRELAPVYDLKLYPQRRSIHLGETLLCQVILTPEGGERLSERDRTVPWKIRDSIMEMPFKPLNVGTKDIGPIELKLAGISLRSDSFPVTILPSVGTNDLMEVRVLNRKVRKGQTIEVVVQWQTYERINFPSPSDATLPIEDTMPDRKTHGVGWGYSGGGPLIRTADWEVYRNVPGIKYSYMRNDIGGVFQLEGGIQTYTFIPVRSGQLILSVKLFQDVSRLSSPEPHLPPSFAFEPITITVEEAANNQMLGTASPPEI